jgi:hypothetical protein
MNFLKRPGGCEREGQQSCRQGERHMLRGRRLFPNCACCDKPTTPVDAHRRNFLAGGVAAPSVSQIMYGTDYPFRDGAEVNNGIAAYGFSPADVRAIERENALTLLPRLKAAG